MTARAAAELDEAIDALYRLPPGEFTPARNALAKAQAAGEARDQVRRLEKPTAVPWAVNQLYWQARPVFDRLIEAGAALRAAQIDALEGRANRAPKATLTHRQAVAEAVRRAIALAATVELRPPEEPLTRMLEALSTAPHLPAAPGRFTVVMQPSGFEAVAGVAPTGPKPQAAPSPDARRRERQTALDDARRDVESAKQAEARAQARLQAAREHLAQLEDEVREARNEVKRASDVVRRKAKALGLPVTTQ